MAHLSDYYRFFSECDEFKLQKFESFKNLGSEFEDIEVSSAQSAIAILTAQKYSDARDYITFAKRETLDKLIPTVGTVRQMVWVPPCLIEGTKITLTDGTQKNIEECVPGDRILSYDPVEKAQCEAVVLEAYMTGTEHRFDFYIFNDGSALTIYGTHGYYDTNAKTIRDLKAKRTWAAGLNVDGEPVKVVSIKPFYKYGDEARRYNLISSNNLYYANGILCGSKPVNKYQYYARRGIKLPEEIKEILLADCEEYNAYNAFFQSPEYLKRTAALRTEYFEAHSAVVRKKAALADLDYKTIKVAEGVAEADTLEDVIPVKNRLREEIDANRAIYRDRLAKIKAIEEEMLDGKSEQTVFEACCNRDNESFSAFEAWICGDAEENA